MAKGSGRRRVFTDEQLREDLDEGLKPAQIAQKYGVSRQSVYERINLLDQTTLAAAVAPAESQRFTRRTIDGLQELIDSLSCVRLLRDACERYLADPDHPGQYFIGERASDIDVIYLAEGEDGKLKSHKKKLQKLLDEVGAVGQITTCISEFADPRELIIKACAEARKTVEAGVRLAQLIADFEEMERLRDAILAAVARASPEVCSAIQEELRRDRVVGAAFQGPQRLPDGRTE